MPIPPRTEPLPLAEAAQVLGVSRATLKRLIAAGAPQARRGRRGRGGAALVIPAHVAAWRGSAAAADTAVLTLIAARAPERLAIAIDEAFRLIDGPHKRAAAGALAATWYASTVALLDLLREHGAEADDPHELPPQIAHLRAIWEGSRTTGS
jgi:hypothetical protein